MFYKKKYQTIEKMFKTNISIVILEKFDFIEYMHKIRNTWENKPQRYCPFIQLVNMCKKSLQYDKNNFITLNIFIFISRRYYPGGMGHVHKIINSLSNVKMFNQTTQLLPLSNRFLNITDKLKKKELQDMILNKPSNVICYVSPNKNKDFFLKTVEQINEIPYDKECNLNMPITYKPIVSSISGIWQTPTQINNNVEFEQILAQMCYKFVHSFFSGSLIKNKLELFLRIRNFLLYNVYYYYPLAQHMITSVFARINIPAEVLEYITENLVDYSAYKEVNVASVSLVEASVFKITMLEFMREHQNNLNIIAQNPDNSLGDPINFESLSYKQGKQPHMDFRIENYSVETNKNKMIFLDSKLYADPVKTLSLSRGYLSLSTSIDYNYLMKRFKGDIIGTGVQKKVPKVELDLIKKYAQKIDDIIKDKKLSITLFFSIKKQIFLDKKITTIVPSFIFTPMDNIFYHNYITCTMTLEDIRSLVQQIYKETKKILLLEQKPIFLETMIKKFIIFFMQK